MWTLLKTSKLRRIGVSRIIVMMNMLELLLCRVIGSDFLNCRNHFSFIPIIFIEVEIVKPFIDGQVVVVWGNGRGTNFGTILFMGIVVGCMPPRMKDYGDCCNDKK